MKGTVTIVGNGRVGGAMARVLANAGYLIDGVVSRRPGAGTISWSDDLTIQSDFVIVAVSDADISSVGQLLATKLSGRQIVFHTSGSRSSDELSDLRRVGCRVGSIHPLVSVSDPEVGASRFIGSYFCIEGDQEAVASASVIVADIGGHAFSIPTDAKPRYHAAAVTACGHVVALFDIALEIMSTCGIERDAAKDALLPLVAGTVSNLADQEPAAALTGPFARGDAETVDRHLSSLTGIVNNDALSAYLDLAWRSISLAESGGLGDEMAARLRDRILMAKSDLKC